MVVSLCSFFIPINGKNQLIILTMKQSYTFLLLLVKSDSNMLGECNGYRSKCTYLFVFVISLSEN